MEVRNIDIRDLQFFKYQLYGIIYLKFCKDLKKHALEFLMEHNEEDYFLSKYREYGPSYLKFLHDAKELNLDEIIDMKGFRESKNSCILKWVFMNLDENRRRIESNYGCTQEEEIQIKTRHAAIP